MGAALPAGRLKFGMIPVPMGATRVTVAVDRRRFGAFTGTVQWQLWLCVDNASWAEWGAGTAPSPYREARERSTAEFERSYVSALLRMTGGNMANAARVMERVVAESPDNICLANSSR